MIKAYSRRILLLIIVLSVLFCIFLLGVFDSVRKGDELADSPEIEYVHHLPRKNFRWSTNDFWVAFAFPGVPKVPARLGLKRENVRWNVELTPLPNHDGTFPNVSYHGITMFSMLRYEDGKMPDACTISLIPPEEMRWQCEVIVRFDESIKIGRGRLLKKQYRHVWRSDAFEARPRTEIK